ncbi:MAG: ABC transporter substrate-binding protein [Chloroflexi bacterium]|nr:ABC transporter substrate-binding protein [Chloroflexota bacterium]
MLRGFRWQLVAFLLALALFFAAGLFRLSRQSGPQPAPEATASPTVTATPANAPTTVVAQASDTPPQSGRNRYREGIVGSIQRLNPLFAHLNPADRDITSLIFEGLFDFNEYGETVPRLAAELVVSSDRLDYVVRLRNDIHWQNGIPFNADDVIYTASLMSDPHYAEISPAGAFWQSVETQKLSQDLIRFRLAQPYSSFPNLLTFGILPEHALRGTTIDHLAHHPFNLAPIGTGAYQLVDLGAADGQGITAVNLALAPTYRQRQEAQTGYLLHELRFNFYADSAAALDAYRSGETDGLAEITPPAALDSLPQSRHYRQVDSTLGILIFNWRNAPFEERRLRRALSLSLDVPQLVQTHFATSATYADSPYVPGSSAYKPDFFWQTYDLASAQELLNEAKPSESETNDAAADKDDSTIEPVQPYSLVIEDSASLRAMANEIVSQWQLLGLDFLVEPLDPASLRNRLETGRFDTAIITQRIGADPDLFRFWHPAESGGGNYGAAADNQLAEIIENARGEIFPTRRALLFQEFQELFAEQAIAIPLYYPIYTFVVRDSIEGIQLGYMVSPADRFRGIQDWRYSTTTS